MKRWCQSLLVWVCFANILFPFVAASQPAHEAAKALARAAAAAITNDLARFPEDRDLLLADAQPTLAYYQQVQTTINWNEFITSTSPVPPALHMTFQFYFGVRTNFDDIDPWERLGLCCTLPVAEAALDPGERRELAKKDKQIRLMWLGTFLELGPEQVLTRYKYLPPFSTLGMARQTILELFEQHHLLEALTAEDWEIVAHCLHAFQNLRNADLLKIALERASITGTQADTNWIKRAQTSFLNCQYLPYIASIVLGPGEQQGRPVNTNLVSAWLEPVAVWLEDQCWQLEQLLEGMAGLYRQGLYLWPHSGFDRRPIYRFKAGLNALIPALVSIPKAVTPTETPRQPRPLRDEEKRMLVVVQAYRPFDPDSADLSRALGAVNRGDLDTCGQTLCVEFAIRNLYHPLSLLASWTPQLPENKAIAESVTNVVTRLNRLSQLIQLIETGKAIAPPSLYRKTESSTTK